MLAALAAASLGSAPSCPPALSADDVARMSARMTHMVPGRKGAKGVPGPQIAESKLWTFEYACVDQETIVLHDPRRMADTPGRPHTTRGDGLERMLDFSDDPYYFRQGSQAQAQAKLASLGQEGAPALEHPTATVYGYARSKSNSHHEIPVRLASAEEVRALKAPFSRCTTPIVFQTIWSHNLGEWLSRAPPAFAQHTRSGETGRAGVMPTSLAVVLASPDKLPVPAFNLAMLRPFTSLEPSSFADFSSRLPADYASNSTHEGRHAARPRPAPPAPPTQARACY